MTEMELKEIIRADSYEPDDETLEEHDSVLVASAGMYGDEPRVWFSSREEPEWSNMYMSLGELAYEFREVGTLVEVKNGKYRVMTELYRGW
jgi:hypothetical protein